MVVLLGLGASAAVIYAGVVGAFGLRAAAAAVAVALAIAALSFHQARPGPARGLQPLPEDGFGPVVVRAPRAAEAAGAPARRSDAA